MQQSNEILQHVVNDTETIFGRIAERYPALLKELETGINAAAESIKKMAETSGDDGSSTDEDLESYLERSRLGFNESLSALEGYEKRNNEIIRRLMETIRGYRASQQYISEIRDISESLQIVSINALVNAVKAGRGGEGFSVITDNLKTVTGMTIEKTGNLERRGTNTQKMLERFGESESSISEYRKDLFTSIEEFVKNGLDVFQKESEIVRNLFRDLYGESGRIREYILRVMEELQQQDLIRQTIDQILLSINEIPRECLDGQGSCGESGEEDLDRAVFSHKMLSLSVTMINEVVAQLDSSFKVFSDNFNKAEERLEYIQTTKNQSIANFLSNIKTIEDMDIIEQSVREKTRLLKDKRHDLLSEISRIITEVGEISSEILSFESISGWLQNVSVLSRIELSRSVTLRKMKESVDDMYGLVERIQEQVNIGGSETHDFINATELIFSDYTGYVNEELVFVDEFIGKFLNRLDQMHSISNTFTSSLRNFNFFSEEFKDLFSGTKKELMKMEELAASLRDVSTRLAESEKSIHKLISGKTGGIRLEDWQFSNKEFDKVIQSFTIYSHKRVAGDIGGLSVEQSELESGEVTFF